MAKVIFGDKSKKGTFNAKITGAHFFWAKLDEPVKKYGTKTGEMQYEVKVVVGQAVADQLEEINLNKELVELRTEYKKEKEIKKFEIYADLVKAAAAKGETLYLMSLTQKAESAAGKKLFVKVVGRNGEVELDEKIGHGSYGSFRIYCYPGADDGPSAGKINCSLNAVQILNLVEYVESDHSEEGLGDLGFGNYDDDEEGGSEEGSSGSQEEDDGSADPFADFG